MVDRPADLPDYEHPPLVEVVLSVQFAELQGYRTVHAGLLWEGKFRQAYHRVVEQPPLDPTFEVFGPQQSAPAFTMGLKGRLLRSSSSGTIPALPRSSSPRSV
jgi:hypothetical protein